MYTYLHSLSPHDALPLFSLLAIWDRRAGVGEPLKASSDATEHALERLDVGEHEVEGDEAEAHAGELQTAGDLAGGGGGDLLGVAGDGAAGAAGPALGGGLGLGGAPGPGVGALGALRGAPAIFVVGREAVIAGGVAPALTGVVGGLELAV